MTRWDKSKLPSRHVSVGPKSAPHRAFYYAMGMTDEEVAQPFIGVVIARQGRGMNETFTVRRIVNNEGVERIFPLQSPRIVGVEVTRHGKTRRGKLYYLRNRVGKARKLRERVSGGHGSDTAAAGAAAGQAPKRPDRSALSRAPGVRTKKKARAGEGGCSARAFFRGRVDAG